MRQMKQNGWQPMMNLATGIQMLFLMLMLVACGGKLTAESFEKVKEGMTAEEVKTLLGQPTETSTASIPIIGDVTTYKYKTEKSEVTITLHQDKVKLKAGTVAE